jgi:hypothetical protein
MPLAVLVSWLIALSTSTNAFSKTNYVFDPEELKAMAWNASQAKLDTGEMLHSLENELRQINPDHIVPPNNSWPFNEAGGAFFQIHILYCTAHEYLIFFGTDIPTGGYTGRYGSVNFWDYYLEGGLDIEGEGEFHHSHFGPGSWSFLERNNGKVFHVPQKVWVMEYARGNILSAFQFGVLASAESGMLDWHYAFKQIHDCAASATHEAFHRKKRRK